MPDIPKREILAWTFYDFANSGYTTVVLTTLFNAYFVSVVASENGLAPGSATFLWTILVAAGNGLVLLSAPIVGAVVDHRAWKKRGLVVCTIGCVFSTASLGLAGPDSLVLTAGVFVFSLVMFGTGEYLIAAFLPEISKEEQMGRISGYGWGLGYFGGLLTLALCLAWLRFAESWGWAAAEAVPVTLWITAAIFAVAALPTLLVLRERATPAPAHGGRGVIAAGFARVAGTLSHARRFVDLFRFLLALVLFQAGMSTVIVIAGIYAQQVFGFASDELVVMIMVVNLTAALGAFGMGHLQDRIGSIRALALALCLWIVAIVLILLAEARHQIWLPANLIGLALGGTQSAGRALVGKFTPAGRSGEFFGLWGLAMHLAMIIGPLSYGGLGWIAGGDQRLALLSTLALFVAALVVLATVSERRGQLAARSGALNPG